MAKLPKDPENWLSEHLVYERWMLDYTYSRLGTDAATPLWFAMFESFAVHARNLYDFVRGGDGNVQASAFIGPTYAKPEGVMGETVRQFSPHVLHMGDARATTSDAKANSEDASAIYAWLRKQLDAFDAQLDGRYPMYTQRLSKVIKPAQPVIVGPPSATNIITILGD